MTVRTVVFIAAGWFASVGRGSAQQTQGLVAMSAGSATDVTGASSRAVTLSPSLTAEGLHSEFSLTGSGTRFTSRAWSAMAMAAFSGRAAGSVVSSTVDLSASAAATSYSISYVTVDATPALEAHLGAARLFGGAHVGAASSSGIAQTQPAVPLTGIATARSSRSSTMSAAIVGAALTFADGNGNVTLTYRNERGIVAGAYQDDDVLLATLGNDNVALSTSIGRRSTAGQTVGFGSGALTVGVTPSMAMQFSAGRYPSNRMLGTPAGQFLNAGFNIRFGGIRSSLPRPNGVAPIAAGMTRLLIRADDATTVEVTGEFNQWEFVPAQRAGNGVWFADLRIPPGQYRYAFRINGKEWRIPEGVPAADDEFGGKSAWLTVNRTAGRPEQY